jgi:hypothetical protein
MGVSASTGEFGTIPFYPCHAHMHYLPKYVFNLPTSLHFILIKPESMCSATFFFPTACLQELSMWMCTVVYSFSMLCSDQLHEYSIMHFLIDGHLGFSFLEMVLQACHAQASVSVGSVS